MLCVQPRSVRQMYESADGRVRRAASSGRAACPHGALRCGIHPARTQLYGTAPLYAFASVACFRLEMGGRTWERATAAKSRTAPRPLPGALSRSGGVPRPRASDSQPNVTGG